MPYFDNDGVSLGAPALADRRSFLEDFLTRRKGRRGLLEEQYAEDSDAAQATQASQLNEAIRQAAQVVPSPPTALGGGAPVSRAVTTPAAIAAPTQPSAQANVRTAAPPVVDTEAYRQATSNIAEATPILANAAMDAPRQQFAQSDAQLNQGQQDVNSLIDSEMAALNAAQVTPSAAAQPYTEREDWYNELRRNQRQRRVQGILDDVGTMIGSASGRVMTPAEDYDEEAATARRMAIARSMEDRRNVAQSAQGASRLSVESSDPNSSVTRMARQSALMQARVLASMGDERAARDMVSIAKSPTFTAELFQNMIANETLPLQQILKSSTTAQGHEMRMLGGREAIAGRAGNAGLGSATDVDANIRDNETARYVAELRNALKPRGGGRGGARAGISPQALDLYARVISAKGTLSYDDAYLAAQQLAADKGGRAFRTQLGSILAPAGREASGGADDLAAMRLIQADGTRRAEGLGLVRRAEDATGSAATLTPAQMQQVLAYSRTGWVPDVAMSEAQQDMLDNLHALTNVYLHKQSGAAVNAHEAERLMGELGINQMTSPGHVSRALRTFSNRAKDDYQAQYGQFDAFVQNMGNAPQASVVRPRGASAAVPGQPARRTAPAFADETEARAEAARRPGHIAQWSPSRRKWFVVPGGR